MEMTEPRYRPDWPSRVLALFSLLVVGLAVGYVVIQHQVAHSRDDLRADFRDALQVEAARQQQAMDERLEAFQQSADKLLNEQLAKYDQQLQELTVNHQKYLDQLAASNQENFSTLGRQLRTEIATRLAGTGSEPVSADTADAEGTPQASDPVRHAAHLVFRPVRDNDHRVRVENPTNQPIQIHAVSFIPRQVHSSREVSMQGEEAGAVDRQLTFEPRDNQAANPQMQGVYRQALSPAWTLAAGESQVLELAIRNAEHLGYVLTGELELHVEGQDLPPVQNISVPFVGQEPST